MASEAEDAEVSAKPEDSTDRPKVAQIEFEDEDFGGGDLFSDIEDAERIGDGSADEEFAEPRSVGSLETAINEGAARLAVVGLEDADDLESEFQEIFEAFRLGYYGSEVAEEYVLGPEHDQIDPVWGLLGSVLICAAVTLWLRPDGDEQVERITEVVGNVAGKVAA